jgi:recombinational DNA repair protein RecT
MFSYRTLINSAIRKGGNIKNNLFKIIVYEGDLLFYYKGNEKYIIFKNHKTSFK